MIQAKVLETAGVDGYSWLEITAPLSRSRRVGELAVVGLGQGMAVAPKPGEISLLQPTARRLRIQFASDRRRRLQVDGPQAGNLASNRVVDPANGPNQINADRMPAAQLGGAAEKDEYPLPVRVTIGPRHMLVGQKAVHQTAIRIVALLRPKSRVEDRGPRPLVGPPDRAVRPVARQRLVRCGPRQRAETGAAIRVIAERAGARLVKRRRGDLARIGLVDDQPGGSISAQIQVSTGGVGDPGNRLEIVGGDRQG
jgi:hypothetical protein